MAWFCSISCLQTGVQLDASYRALTQQRHQQANERTRTVQQVDAQDILNAQRNARLREPASMKSAIKRNVSLSLHSVPHAKANLIMCLQYAVVLEEHTPCLFCTLMMEPVVGFVRMQCVLCLRRLKPKMQGQAKSSWTRNSWRGSFSSCLSVRCTHCLL